MLISVDPGLSGAIAIFDRQGYLCNILDMPTRQVKVTKGFQNRVNAEELLLLLSKYESYDVISVAIVENVGPSTSTSGSFAFGRGLGVVEGILASMGVPIEYVAPNTWKKHFGLKADKATSLDKAVELYPYQRALFSRKKDDGRAEAALIGQWAIDTERKPK